MDEVPSIITIFTIAHLSLFLSIIQSFYILSFSVFISLFFFTLAQNSDELSVTANEVVMVIEDPGDGWLKVKRGNDSGYVPSTYVQLT